MGGKRACFDGASSCSVHGVERDSWGSGLADVHRDVGALSHASYFLSHACQMLVGVANILLFPALGRRPRRDTTNQLRLTARKLDAGAKSGSRSGGPLASEKVNRARQSRQTTHVGKWRRLLGRAAADLEPQFHLAGRRIALLSADTPTAAALARTSKSSLPPRPRIWVNRALLVEWSCWKEC